MLRRVLVVSAALSLVMTACSDDADTVTTTVPATTITTTTEPAMTTTPQGWRPPTSGFTVPLAEVPLVTDGNWPGPEWPTTLDAVAFADAVPATLTERLAADGFVIDGSQEWRHLAWLYDTVYPYGERPVFVTTDAAYHHWHLVFDRVLREVEATQLLPILERFTLAMVDAARSDATALAGGPGSAEAAGAVAYLEALATVLELDVGPISQAATAEVALVLEHTAWTGSPALGGNCAGHDGSCVDYSLMTPRGHYTRTEQLTRFFRGMSLLAGVAADLDDEPALRVMLAIARLVTIDEARAADWAAIYHPTAFLVGAADDYTPLESVEAALARTPAWADDPSQIAALPVTDVAADLRALRTVGIDPGRASLRVMGSRFVYDSWVYDGLAEPFVAGRFRVSPLDLAAVFGSDWALARQDDAGETAYAGYDEAIAAFRADAASHPAADWGATAYGAWLWSLQAVWNDYAEAYPPFMRGDAWAAKSHQTGFGSYTELKHDTILYAKQGMAEGDMPMPPARTHWVEPDPVAFARIAAATRVLRDGLLEFGLLPGVDDEPWTLLGYVEQYLSVVDRLAAIAAAELAGDPIGAEDNEFLGQIGGWLGALLWASSPEEGPDDRAALVADVFLDTGTDTVLEVGTADFNPIYVIVPDGAGGFQVATGGVYAYHEFWQPRDDRLTDEAWWGWIEDGTLPPRPAWVTEFLGL